MLYENKFYMYIYFLPWNDMKYSKPVTQNWTYKYKNKCCYETQKPKLLWRWLGFIYGCLSALNVSLAVCRDEEQCWHVNHKWCCLERQGEAPPVGTLFLNCRASLAFYCKRMKTPERATEKVLHAKSYVHKYLTSGMYRYLILIKKKNWMDKWSLKPAK